jgi:hypothetical protein
MRNQRRNNKRQPRRARQEGSSILSKPFDSLTNFTTALTASTQSINFTFAGLLPDLASSAPPRLVKLKRIVFRFNPINTVAAASNITVQILWTDPTTLANVPISRLLPLSDVNRTILTGNPPNLLTGWQSCTSVSTVAAIRIVSSAAQSISYVIEATFELARDVI